MSTKGFLTSDRLRDAKVFSWPNVLLAFTVLTKKKLLLKMTTKTHYY